MSPTRQIEPELLQRLGALVAHWAVIDQYVAHLFIGLVEGDPGAMYVVTENISSNTVSGWVRTLLEVRPFDPQAYPDKIREVLTEIDELRAERNALVHGVWDTKGAELGSVFVQTVRLERAEVVKTEVVTAADLDELIDRVIIVRRQFKEILDEMGIRA